MSHKRKIQDILDTLAEGSTEVRADSSEANYQKWENRLDKVAKEDKSSFVAYVIAVAFIGFVLLFIILPAAKKSGSLGSQGVDISDGSGDAVLETEVGRNPTQLTPPQNELNSIPSNTPLNQKPFIEIINGLLSPIYIYAYENENTTYIRVLDAGATERLEFSANTINMTWVVKKNTMSTGMTIGNEMRETLSNISSGSVLKIDNVVAGSVFMLPIINNRTNIDCEFSINDGYVSEYRPNGVVRAHAENVVLGYYRYYSNSNITLWCDDNQVYWWGEHPIYGGEQLSSPTGPEGILRLTVVQ
jgi:hypothetical protein